MKRKRCGFLNMNIFVNIAAICIGLGLILWVMRLVVRQKMSESQSVLWIGIGIAAIILGSFPGLIPKIAGLLGIWYAPSVLLLVATVGLLLILFRNSSVVSIHADEIHELAIQMALLKDENEVLKARLAGLESDRD